MKVKTHKLWQHVGRTIEIKDSTDEYVPNGVYLVIGKDQGGCIEIGNLINRETALIEEYDEYDEVILVDHQINLEELIEFKLATCVGLIQDGWRLGGTMDLLPYFIELGSLTQLQKLKAD
jgi:hypothetical protein